MISILALAATVTLTQPELQSLLAAESAHAVANYAAAQAKPVYDKVNKAFAPAPVPSPTSTPAP